jgi:hypothetical protein
MGNLPARPSANARAVERDALRLPRNAVVYRASIGLQYEPMYAIGLDWPEGCCQPLVMDIPRLFRGAGC